MIILIIIKKGLINIKKTNIDVVFFLILEQNINEQVDIMLIYK